MDAGTVETEQVSRAEGAVIVDNAAQRLLSMSGDEFMSRWDAGEDIEGDHVAIMKVAMLLPLAR